MGLKMKERKPIYREIAKRYQKANKKEKGKILDEFVGITGLKRCYSAYLLRNHGKKVYISKKTRIEGDIVKKGKQGRKKKYGDEVFKVLKKIWMTMDCICSKRLKAVLPEVIDNLKMYGEIEIDPEIERKLKEISPSTIDRLLVNERKKMELKGKSMTKPGTLLKHQIPIRTFSNWDEQRPGFMEIDLVSHDGGNASGEFAYSLNMTDVYSGWVETVCLKNKAAIWVKAALHHVRKYLPFDLLGIDSDSGSEFINTHIFNYCKINNIKFTRGRSYKKNDNCYVEQKNNTIVRRVVGYRRYDSEEEVRIINQIYNNLRLYNNHFQPSMKLIEKTYIGSKIKKKYDQPKTPFQRLIESEHLDPLKKQELIDTHKSLNLYELKKKITALQKELLELQSHKYNFNYDEEPLILEVDFSSLSSAQ